MPNIARAARAPDTTPAQQRLRLTLVSDEAWRESNRLALQLAIEREAEQRRRRVRLIIIGASWSFVAMVGLYFAGYLFGSSPLGAFVALMIGLGAAFILGVFWFVTHAHRVHCPGCPAC